MRRIIKIVGVEQLKSKTGDIYHRCHVVLDTGEEAVGFGKDFTVGDLVECFFHRGMIKVRKTPTSY